MAALTHLFVRAVPLPLLPRLPVVARVEAATEEMESAPMDSVALG